MDMLLGGWKQKNWATKKKNLENRESKENERIKKKKRDELLLKE